MIDYSEQFQIDSSSFAAWLLVEGDFSFHPDSGIGGDKALVKYIGKRQSAFKLKDSLASQQDSSSFIEYIASQDSLLKVKDKKIRRFPWLPWVVGIVLVVWVIAFFRMKNEV